MNQEREFKKYLLLALFIFLTTSHSYAQFGSINFQNLRAESLSNEQVIELYERAEEQGLSISQLELIARTRGMNPIEISKLRERLLELERNPDLQTESDLTTVSGLRTISNIPFEGDGKIPIDTLNHFLEIPKSRIFGASIFSNTNISFEPSLNIPTPKNYKLGPGDELSITIWGASESVYNLTINPEGNIVINSLGPINVSGLTINEASTKIKERLSGIYAGLREPNPNTFAQISLGNLKSIQVSLVGEVNVPGTYTLTSFSTVFNALYAANGPSENGTFRSIQLIRNGNIYKEIDLYDFLVTGNLSSNVMLEDQDIIKVNTYKNRISLEGEAKRTGHFELINGETFEDLIKFSGGFSEEAYTRRISIQRNTSTERSVLDINYPDESNIELRNGDFVNVEKILNRFQNRVTIEGAVYRPGSYQIEKNPTLYTLLANAEGLTGDAFTERAVIYRLRSDFSIESIPVNLTQVLTAPELNDIELKNEDQIHISSIFDLREERTVTINGSVLSPGLYDYFENYSLEDLILAAGGFTEDAEPYRIEIARRIKDLDSEILENNVTEIIQISIEHGLEFSDELDKAILKPFDQVFVRNSPNYEEQQLVTINGEVLYPGVYAIGTRDFRLADLIEASGGINEFAYIEGASLEREFEDYEENLELNLEDSILTTIEETESLSKVGINLDEAMRNPDSPANLLLQEGDVITIPKKLETIQVRGEVLYPVNIRFDERNSFNNYINSAGGFTEDANKRKAYIVYANGDVDRTKRFLFFKNTPDVKPGSVIIVPPKEEKEKLSSAERITMYSTIVSLAAIITNTIFQIRNSGN